MKIKFNKNGFVNGLLAPASKLTDNVSLDFETNADKVFIKTIVPSPDNSVIFLSQIECSTDKSSKFIIPECKTFLRLFSNIDRDTIELTLEDNAITYNSDQLSFKYHLLDEGYLIEKKSISEAKLNQIKFDTKFITSKIKFSEIVKFNSIVPDAEKLYFYTEGSKVIAKIGDDQKANTNEIKIELSEKFEGETCLSPIALNIQNILLMSFISNDIEVSINHQLKLVKLSSGSSYYIVSGLVK